MLKLNTFDKKAISSIMIAQAAMFNVNILLKEALEIEDKSEYYKTKVKRILEQCIEFNNWLNKTNDRFAMTMNRNDKVTMINRATNHITKSDELMGNKLNVYVEEIGDKYIKKTVSAITIVQSSLINADNIFSKSLKYSKKDMQTKDIIMDILDKINEYIDWIEDIVFFMATTMSKAEYNAVIERANNYIKLTDKENGLL